MGPLVAQRESLLARRPRAQEVERVLARQRLVELASCTGTLLDRTLVLWGSEVSKGNTHSHTDMPFLLAGHAPGWKMGRVLNFGSRPHNDLLVSVLQGFGGKQAMFGDPTYFTAPLAGLNG